MRHIGVILVIILAILCMTAPALARSASFKGSGSINWPNLKLEVVKDEQGNTAISQALVMNGVMTSTQSSGTAGGAHVGQDIKAKGSVIIVKSIAINSSGSLASTVATSLGNATMDTHQTAGSDDFGAKADQTTSLDLTDGVGYMGTYVNDKNDEMSTTFYIKGTGKISTDQSGVVGASSEYSTIKIKQFSDIWLESGQAHSSMLAPTGLLVYTSNEGFYHGARVKDDQFIDRIVNETNFQEDCEHFTNGTLDGCYTHEMSARMKDIGIRVENKICLLDYGSFSVVDTININEPI